MSCKIHVWVETFDGSRWVPAMHLLAGVHTDVMTQEEYDAFRVDDASYGRDVEDQCYDFFGELSGVRRDGAAHFADRGFPRDSSLPLWSVVTTRKDGSPILWVPSRHEPDLHSAGWCTLREFRDLVDYDHGLTRWAESTDADPDNTRILFAYDD